MAHKVPNNIEIQKDEIEALRSIYMEDFEEEEVKTGAWNVGDSILNLSRLCLAIQFMSLTSNRR